MGFKVELKPITKFDVALRVAEILCAFISFICLVTFSSTGKGSVMCAAEDSREFLVTVYYPFNLNDVRLTFPVCFKNSSSLPWHLRGDYRSSAQFLAFVAITAAMISIGKLIFYVKFRTKMGEVGAVVCMFANLIVTFIWTIFWLSAALACAVMSGQLSKETSPDRVCGILVLHCTTIQSISFSALNASIAFAFISLVLWGFHGWRSFSEAKPYIQLYRAANAQQQVEEAVAEDSDSD